MTRGQIAIITPEGKILTSIEFNGDMYYEGYGKDVYDYLECVKNVEEYKELVQEFNKDKFNYQEELFYECDDSYLDMKNNYFGKWFSDYVYIKNLCENPVVFTDSNCKKIQLEAKTTVVFNYGEFVATSDEEFEKKLYRPTERKERQLILRRRRKLLQHL